MAYHDVVVSFSSPIRRPAPTGLFAHSCSTLSAHWKEEMTPVSSCMFGPTPARPGLNLPTTGVDNSYLYW